MKGASDADKSAPSGANCTPRRQAQGPFSAVVWSARYDGAESTGKEQFMRVLAMTLISLLLISCGEAPPPTLPTAPAVPEAAPDTDGDGVADTADACPTTASGVAVDGKGCDLDSDGDGIADSMDKCPASPSGNAVDATGCEPRLESEQSLTLKVDFASGSANIIGDAANGVLLEVVALLQKYPESSVRIEGYTDNRGSSAKNLALSQQRAEAVAKVITEQLGIDAQRVSATGMGDANPVASNGTREGRGQNRRVVAVVLPGQ
jgi:OOP family OmpA-OmpF porin